jgi:hypothetical protein
VRVSFDEETTTSAVALGSDSDRGGVLIHPARNPSLESGIHTRLDGQPPCCDWVISPRPRSMLCGAYLFSLNSACAAAVVAASFVDRRRSFSGSMMMYDASDRAPEPSYKGDLFTPIRPGLATWVGDSRFRGDSCRCISWFHTVKQIFVWVCIVYQCVNRLCVDLSPCSFMSWSPGRVERDAQDLLPSNAKTRIAASFTLFIRVSDARAHCY